MAREKASRGWSRKAIGLVGIAVLALTLLEFPRYPYTVSHDPSSQAAFEYYAAHHFQFGEQVYQNVGPYGYLYFPSVYAGYLPVRKIFLGNISRVALLILVVWASRRLPGNSLKVWWWASFLALQPFGWSPLWAGDSLKEVSDVVWEQIYAYLIAYLAVLYLLQDRKDRCFYVCATLLLVFLAFFALIKHTSFFLAVGAVGAAAIQNLLRKRFSIALAGAGLFSVFLLVHWALAGQQLANFGAFVRGVFVFSSGYNEAMMLPEPASSLIASLMVIGALGLRSAWNGVGRSWRESVKTKFWIKYSEAEGIGRMLFEWGLLFIAWKHAYVRADLFHAVLFFLAAALLAVPFFFVAIPDTMKGLASDETERKTAPAAVGDGPVFCLALGRRSAAFASFFLVVALAVGSLALGLGGDFRYRPIYLTRRLQENVSWLISPGTQLARLSAQLRDTESANSLPLIKARVGAEKVDHFGLSPGWLLLNHLNYWSRPMPITFAAANAELQRANERFYRDPKSAPAFVTCMLQVIDDRFLPQGDALAFRALLDNYRPVLSERGLLLLERNDRLLETVQKEAIIEDKPQLGAEVPLTGTTNQAIWVETTIERSFLGKLRSFLYKPAPCFILWHFAGETERRYRRYVTSMGGTGCMITPFIGDNDQLLKFYRGTNRLQEFQQIRSFTIACQPSDAKFFEGEYQLRLYEVLWKPKDQGADKDESPKIREKR